MSESGSSPEVVLHIGTMKTGTSYLQRLLARNATALADAGVLDATTLPGVGRLVRESVGDGESERSAGVLAAGWSGLADQMTAWPGRTVVLSNELLSFATAPMAEAVIASFGQAPVTVVVTARDLVRVVPSAWQNKIKHGRSWSFQTYVSSIMAGAGEAGGPARSFWHHHDLGRIVRTWVGAAGRDRVVVIPVPPADAPPDVLWERFASVLRVDPHAFDTDQDRKSNQSMGYAETELVRQVNRGLRAHLDKETQRRLVLKHLANEVLRPDPSETSDRMPISLGPAARAWAVDRSRAMAAEVETLGVRVVGPLHDLVPSPPSVPRDDDPADDLADELAPPEVPAGFVRAVTALIMRIAELEQAADPSRALASPSLAEVRERRRQARRRAARAARAGDTSAQRQSEDT